EEGVGLLPSGAPCLFGLAQHLGGCGFGGPSQLLGLGDELFDLALRLLPRRADDPLRFLPSDGHPPFGLGDERLDVRLGVRPLRGRSSGKSSAEPEKSPRILPDMAQPSFSCRALASCLSASRSIWWASATATRASVTAEMVAVRRPPSSPAISPRTAPGPTSATVSPFTSTATIPSRIRYSSDPSSPWRVRTDPAGRRRTRGLVSACMMLADSDLSSWVSTSVTSSSCSRSAHGVSRSSMHSAHDR